LDAQRGLGGDSNQRGVALLSSRALPCFAPGAAMPPRTCAGNNCNRRLAKGDQAKDLNGNCICRKCWQRGRDLAKKERGVAELQDALAKEVKSLGKAVRVEAKRRHALEGKVMGRLLATGEYKLEGKDAKLVPNGVIAHRMEEAELEKKKWEEKAATMSNKLRDARRDGKVQDRARRQELADMTGEVSIAKELCMDLGKKVVRTERKAESYVQTATKAVDVAAAAHVRVPSCAPARSCLYARLHARATRYPPPPLSTLHRSARWQQN
jgi:hypothetical protein